MGGVFGLKCFVRKRLCQEGLLSGRVLSESGLCQKGVLSEKVFIRKRTLLERNFVRKGFCQEAGSARKGFFCQKGILSGRVFVRKRALPGRDFVRKRALPGRNFVRKRDHRAAGFLWFVVRDSCVERLLVCTSASSLIMMSLHWCAPPSRALVAQPQLRAAVGGCLLDTCSLLQPAQLFVRKRSSKTEVLVTVSVEALRRGDHAQACRVAADHAARRHSAARGREGAVQALAVQRCFES